MKDEFFEHDEKVLLRFCLVLSVLGITLTYFASITYSPEEIDIGDIDRADIGEQISITGNATDTYMSDETLFLKLRDSSGSIDVVKFDHKGEKIRRQKVTIEGTITTYQGELEIIAEEINKR